MDDKHETLLRKIKQLEEELLGEIHKKEERFHYEIRERKVRFKTGIAALHRKLVKSLPRYFRDSQWSSIFTAPVIWSCVFPILVLDLWATIYQFICFPAYGIPRVHRRDYILIDRHKLAYLNSMEKFNCAYCGYVNGLLAYVTEIAGRTEQYWCPIKHALRLKTTHSRYQHFIDYGDAEGYRRRIEEVRREFNDLRKP